MTKVVYNACYGGFGLSDAAMLRYAEIKGMTLYVEPDELSDFSTYWTVPLENRTNEPDFYDAHTIYDGNPSRTDPALIQAVEELGSEKASGPYSKLVIEDVPAGTLYHIHECDGFESIRTPGNMIERRHYDWQTA